MLNRAPEFFTIIVFSLMVSLIEFYAHMELVLKRDLF